MPIEIEHKYLIDLEKWKEVIPDQSIEMAQAYMVSEADKTIRVRIAGEKAYLTIKGKSHGASRAEFEYEIPRNEGEQLIKQFCAKIVKKRRHLVVFNSKTWEVDEFLDKNKGLFVAEIELNSEDEKYLKPAWVKENVTSDFKYTNSQLAKHPFCEW
jgi:adenylate cyclase